MENLFKQARVRFSGSGQESRAEPNSSGERRIPPPKTRSFKGERTKAQNWFWRQFSRQMSPDYDSRNGGEYSTVIAAAAFAINSLEEASSQNQKKMSEGPETSLTKSKSKKEDSPIGLPDPGRVSRQFSGKDANKAKQSPGDASTKKSEGLDLRMSESAATNGKMPQEVVGTVPAIKKTPTFVDQYLNDMRKPESESAGDRSTIPNPPFSTRPGGAETIADSWEKTEIDKIQIRYNRRNSLILSWANKKKMKSKRRMDRKESELKQRRARALQHYRSDLTRIDQIAEKARAQAEERRRNDKSKVKEKVKKIRSTGKIPVMCFCF